jgi:hypothetical protein
MVRPVSPHLLPPGGTAHADRQVRPAGFNGGGDDPGRVASRTESGRPVLLRVDTRAGHGFGSAREQRNQLIADILAILLDQLRA